MRAKKNQKIRRSFFEKNEGRKLVWNFLFPPKKKDTYTHMYPEKHHEKKAKVKSAFFFVADISCLSCEGKSCVRVCIFISISSSCLTPSKESRYFIRAPTPKLSGAHISTIPSHSPFLLTAVLEEGGASTPIFGSHTCVSQTPDIRLFE